MREVAKQSMGFDISQLDLDNIVAFAQRVVNLFAYRRNLQVRLG